MFITIFSLIVLLLSIVIHELAHGSAAYWQGDPTAKYAGRLTLNPLAHLDFFGSIILPLTLFILSAGQGPIFGWAKPVPINPHNFRDQRWGILKVSLAGPAANFSIALIFAFLIRILPFLPAPLLVLFGAIAIYNFAWGIFNLVPIPPLDGYHVLFSFLPESFFRYRLFLEQYGLFILVFFIFGGGLNFVFESARSLYFLISG